MLVFNTQCQFFENNSPTVQLLINLQINIGYFIFYYHQNEKDQQSLHYKLYIKHMPNIKPKLRHIHRKHLYSIKKIGNHIKKQSVPCVLQWDNASLLHLECYNLYMKIFEAKHNNTKHFLQLLIYLPRYFDQETGK